MKRLMVGFVVVVVLMLSMAGISYADDSTIGFNGGTKADAIVYIENSLSDPQISEWVMQKFHSKALFLKAVKLAPENAVKSIAVNFSDFQKVGGEVKETGVQVIVWIALILAVGVFMAAVSAL